MTSSCCTTPADPWAEARERFRARVQLMQKAGPFRAMLAGAACCCDGCAEALPAVAGAELDAPPVRVAGVRFRDSGKTYYVDPRDLELHNGQWVVVDSTRGAELAQVVIAPSEIVSNALEGELRPVLRAASEHDLAMWEEFRSRNGEALRIFATKAREHGLPMKPISAEYAFDGSRVTIYFSANGRIDFRELVRDLARTLNCRVELRQVGPRDEARLLGGLGRCGRPLCCSTWLPQFADVSMTMAKNQDLPLNQEKVSGVCGKLLCCLSYENDTYTLARRALPRLGQEVMTEQGKGYVRALHLLREQVTIRLDTGEDVVLDATAIEPLETLSEHAPRRRRRPRRDTAAE